MLVNKKISYTIYTDDEESIAFENALRKEIEGEGAILHEQKVNDQEKEVYYTSLVTDYAELEKISKHNRFMEMIDSL